MSDVAALRAARLAVRAAEAGLLELFQRTYPIGANVDWMHGRYMQTGDVISHNPYHPELRARNWNTNREVSVSLYWILEAEQEKAP